MANNKNLTKAGKGITSTEQAQRMGSKGGKASAASKKRNKTFKEIAQMILSQKPSDEIVAKIKKVMPDMPEDSITNKTVMLLKQLEKASKGDAKSFELLRDTGGEKPKDELGLTVPEGGLPPIQIVIKGD